MNKFWFNCNNWIPYNSKAI